MRAVRRFSSGHRDPGFSNQICDRRWQGGFTVSGRVISLIFLLYLSHNLLHWSAVRLRQTLWRKKMYYNRKIPLLKYRRRRSKSAGLLLYRIRRYCFFRVILCQCGRMQVRGRSYSTREAAGGERHNLVDKGPDTVIGRSLFGDYIKADVLI